MKARVLEDFIDKYTNEYYKQGQIINVSKERVDEILTKGNLVQIMREPRKKAQN